MPDYILYSERRGLGIRHKPDARVYADTKLWLVPNYFVVGIDANVFIQAQNGPYNMDVFPAFWEWIDLQTEVGIIASSTFVFDEIQGEGPLQDWIKSRKKSGLFITPSKDAQEKIAEITTYVLQNYDRALGEFFLSGADPWIIAEAYAQDAKVVTMEKLVPPNSKKVKIPNICRAFKVEWLDTYQLLSELGARFTL